MKTLGTAVAKKTTADVFQAIRKKRKHALSLQKPALTRWVCNRQAQVNLGGQPTPHTARSGASRPALGSLSLTALPDLQGPKARGEGSAKGNFGPKMTP